MSSARSDTGQPHSSNANVPPQTVHGRLILSDNLANIVYISALLVSISIWLIAMRAPLWLDETLSYWQIGGGFSQIWPRQYVCLEFPSYPYILWFSTKLLGTSEIAMRIPSVLAMLGAVYFIYAAAREVVGKEIALLASIIFALNPIVIFESIDIRPYAFASLTVNATILVLLRLRKSKSLLLAALFGLLTALIVSFHFLLGVIAPALLLGFIIVKQDDRKGMVKQFVVAIAVFALAVAPQVPCMRYLFHTGKTHVYEKAPGFWDLFWTIAPTWVVVALLISILAAAIPSRTDERTPISRWQILLFASLGLIPVMILFTVSALTPLHLFNMARHRMAAVPGITLLWAMFLGLFRSRAVRMFFCVVFVSLSVTNYFRTQGAGQHLYSWKFALQFAQNQAHADNAPVLICSDYPESNFAPMPLDSPKDDWLFSPLSYYKLTVPVVPLPRSLNDEAMLDVALFLKQAQQKHQRFLALAYIPSYPTLDWLSSAAAGAYSYRVVGVFDDVKVLEFTPASKNHPGS